MSSRPSSVAVVIPARRDSTRLPRKPFIDESGIALVAHTVGAAFRSQVSADIVIVTDEPTAGTFLPGSDVARIAVSDAEPASALERVAWALRSWWPDSRRPHTVIVLHADQPLIPRAALQALLTRHLVSNGRVSTLLAPVASIAERNDLNAIKVAVSAGNRVRWATRAPIPVQQDGHPFLGYRHCGADAYSTSALMRAADARQSMSERVEQIELLRPIEAGIAVRAVIVADCPQPLCTRGRYEDALPTLTRRRMTGRI
ncbi:MAG: NTP transferase domain-containing protein [Planctomycetaceae bacterium]|nr:NTP transferase domain-containing protein [Planctomycetaceae bacterium]